MDENKVSSIEKNTKKLRNSIILSFLFLFVTVAIFAGQTYAYFWDSSITQSNRFDTGYLNVEFFEVQSNSETTDNAATLKFLPGQTVDKTIKIVNTGTVPVYVRVKIKKTVLDSENNMPSGWEDLIECNFMLDDESTPDILEGFWAYRDGYYYYMSKLDPSVVTPALFDELHFSESIGNEFTNSKIQIKIICQSVQSNGNSESPLTAFGWPAENEDNQD